MQLDPAISDKSFDRRRFGCFAINIILSFAIAFTIFSTSDPTFHTFTLINTDTDTDTDIDTGEIDEKWLQPICKGLNADTDHHCEVEGDVRIDANSSTIFLVKPARSMINATNYNWIIEPYSRSGSGYVKKWKVRLAAEDDASVPKCDHIHSLPALLFSLGGFAGNLFHDFSDLLVPLFTTSFRFNRSVHFLASDYHYQPSWPGKYRPLLQRLTAHRILDIDRQNDTHCYNKLTAGLRYDEDLAVEVAGVSMRRFRQLLRQAYSLHRDEAIRFRGDGHTYRPRLMIVSRKRTRVITNEDQITRTARELGFEVVSAEGEGEGEFSPNSTEFAQLVNSCDVMIGVHGAGLTNMVFLPDEAVLVQIVPLGAMDGISELNFGEPSAEMEIRYLDYKIEVKESSLIQHYPIDHPVLTNPMSIHTQGWDKVRDVYLINQNVTIDIRRFRATLVKAFQLLR